MEEPSRKSAVVISGWLGEEQTWGWVAAAQGQRLGSEQTQGPCRPG